MYHPPRGGVRGGRLYVTCQADDLVEGTDLLPTCCLLVYPVYFELLLNFGNFASTGEDVKTDKYRENYLGHSVHAPVGRWQQGKDLTWYAKDGTPIRPEKEEIDKVKSAEAELMASMLGKKRSKVSQSAQEGVGETQAQQKTDETEQDDDGMTNEEISRKKVKGEGKTKSKDGLTTNPLVVEAKIEMMTAIAGHLDAVQVMRIDFDDGLLENRAV
ncbi:1642_t:CDS:2 [Paraglomus occultum]|uniref:1642_t:CDS:1 n=1 Tax=Paraglomus occultum TaxID=144539 RepID=A0A9N8WLY1_9GLOM|nr:1642_t:CDS:2 [Paraglomus occultum]